MSLVNTNSWNCERQDKMIHIITVYFHVTCEHQWLKLWEARQNDSGYTHKSCLTWQQFSMSFVDNSSWACQYHGNMMQVTHRSCFVWWYYSRHSQTPKVSPFSVVTKWWDFQTLLPQPLCTERGLQCLYRITDQHVNVCMCVFICWASFKI